MIVPTRNAIIEKNYEFFFYELVYDESVSVSNTRNVNEKENRCFLKGRIKQNRKQYLGNLSI